MQIQLPIDNEQQTFALASILAEAIARYSQFPLMVFLRGDLGAGKTTFCRSFIRYFGYNGNVKSPTYTLVEPYELERCQIYHFDLYRLADPEELAFMGIRDYTEGQSICLVEWPDNGGDYLASPDLSISMTHVNDTLEGRQFVIEGESDVGNAILEVLTSKLETATLG